MLILLHVLLEAFIIYCLFKRDPLKDIPKLKPLGEGSCSAYSLFQSILDKNQETLPGSSRLTLGFETSSSLELLTRYCPLLDSDNELFDKSRTDMAFQRLIKIGHSLMLSNDDQGITKFESLLMAFLTHVHANIAILFPCHHEIENEVKPSAHCDIIMERLFMQILAWMKSTEHESQGHKKLFDQVQNVIAKIKSEAGKLGVQQASIQVSNEATHKPSTTTTVSTTKDEMIASLHLSPAILLPYLKIHPTRDAKKQTLPCVAELTGQSSLLSYYWNRAEKKRNIDFDRGQL